MVTYLLATLVGTGGFEPPKLEATDLQSVPFGHSGISPPNSIEKKSRRRDSNPRPADYKSAALPAELLRLFLFERTSPFKRDGKGSNTFSLYQKKQ